MSNASLFDYVAYGSDANCTLAVCPVEASVLGYRPNLAANIVFLALFGVALVLHALQGLLWRPTLAGFAVPIVLGCIDEMIGYGGRIIMYNNPFSFDGFLMQIICITTAPVFFCAAIYVTLARTISFLDASLARFNPKFLYWFFIPGDVLSLVFQAVGGALSSTSSGDNNVGVNLSLFGLSFQVFTLVIFIALAADYLVRYMLAQHRRRRETASPGLPRRLRLYLAFMALAIVLILVRCVYRIDELSDGYSGALFREEGTFYGLESIMIIVAVFCLNIAQPGFGLQSHFIQQEGVPSNKTVTSSKGSSV